jgi:Uma2 family endonuclease
MNTFVIDLPKNYEIGSFEIRNGQYISFEDYLKLDVEGAFLEWVDGKVIGFMSNNLKHQRISGFLITLMKLHSEKNDLGEVVQAGYAMKLEVQKRGREPDLVFVKKENADILTHEYLNGAADIAVEIISPESIERDRQTKFIEYEKAGVREYWLIDPEKKQAEFYCLDESGFYKQVQISDDIFRSKVLDGFFLRLEWLWQENPPTFQALRELNLIQ